MKTDPFQKIRFSWKSNCTYIFDQSAKKTHFFWVQCYFSNPTIWKPTAPAFQNTLSFAQYLFNSRSNMRVNLVHWNSLHSKKAILPTFSGLTPHFLGENHKTRTNIIQHRKAGSVAVILSLRVGVQHKKNSGAIMLSRQVITSQNFHDNCIQNNQTKSLVLESSI